MVDVISKASLDLALKILAMLCICHDSIEFRTILMEFWYLHLICTCLFAAIIIVMMMMMMIEKSTHLLFSFIYRLWNSLYWNINNIYLMNLKTTLSINRINKWLFRFDFIKHHINRNTEKFHQKTINRIKRTGCVCVRPNTMIYVDLFIHTI